MIFFTKVNAQILLFDEHTDCRISGIRGLYAESLSMRDNLYFFQSQALECQDIPEAIVDRLSEYEGKVIINEESVELDGVIISKGDFTGIRSPRSHECIITIAGKYDVNINEINGLVRIEEGECHINGYSISIDKEGTFPLPEEISELFNMSEFLDRIGYHQYRIN